jgi:transcriptional regulator with PAS, ATPase and Fis domain/tetratricopeptide (TPR) repeat protein
LNKEKPSSESGIINLNDARVRLRPRGGGVVSHEALVEELDAARLLLDQGLSTAAEARLESLIKLSLKDPQVLAEARCALSEALDMQGCYRESLEAVQMYEAPDARAKIGEEVDIAVRVRIGLAYNFTGDHPKAIAVLNSALREATDNGSDAQLGLVYVSLAHIYRSINECPIARDHARKSLEHYRNTGEWRGLAEAYMAMALADVFEGSCEAGLENFEQALKLVGDNQAPYLLGKIYANMAAAFSLLKRPQEGIACLEKSISYYERTEHKANAALGYNNLGVNLVVIGEWERAHEALKRALALAFEMDGRGARVSMFRVSMILDSLGELHLLRGDLDEARKCLDRALELAVEKGNKWYVGQATRTLSRCYLAMRDADQAFELARQAVDIAERIGDRQAICSSRLLVAESQLMRGDVPAAAAELQQLAEDSEDAEDLTVTGDAQRLRGLLALAQGDPTLAVHNFGRSISHFEIFGDRYRAALGHYELGRAYASSQPERAAEQLAQAVRTFGALGARLALKDAQDALETLDRNAPERRDEPSALTQLLTLRLAEAVTSRELLLRELAAVIHQETKAHQVLVAESGEEHRTKLVAAHGYAPNEGERIAEQLGALSTESEKERFALKNDSALIVLHTANAAPAWLYMTPGSATLPDGVSLQPLLRVVELGMDVCALRERERAGRGPLEQTAYVDQSLLPGFIHSSPAMTRLVEEVHKIRSSDVTVLVTGESGTGKELVSRAIHALSSRRSKVFVPFNCTAVPKELSEGYLFGYRRGSFTGAVTDSPGVIRSAAGGTLFLDEIGDLPLDVQPKILRFLQEGEIQPLGEQRPIKVDVRIIAATNTDLEDMVKDGRFREDLYYRLNVIRLRVPPLRERRSEIPTIVNYYVNHYSAKFGRRDLQITPQTVDLLMVCDWPGNVRQLCNEVQRVVARAEDGMMITPDHLSPELKRTSAPIAAPTSSVSPFSSAAGLSAEGVTLADAMADLERRMIAEAMRKHNGNISRAARELGLTRRGLYLKLERYQLSASA